MSSGKRKGRRSEDYFDVSVEGRGLIQHVPLSALRIDSPTEYQSEISRRHLPPGKPVILDLRNGEWAHGYIYDPRQRVGQGSQDNSFQNEMPDKHLLSHFPNTPHTPFRSETSLSYSALGHTPMSSGHLTSMVDAFDHEVRRIASERERLREAWYRRKEEETRLGYEREQLRVIMEQTRALRAVEEGTLQKERKRLEAVLQMSAQERSRNLEERKFLMEVITSIEQRGLDQLTDEDMDHFNHLRSILSQSPSVRRSHEEKEELSVIASRLFHEYSFERYSDIAGEERQSTGSRVDLSTSNKTLEDFFKLQNSLTEDDGNRSDDAYDVNHYDEDLVYDRGDRVWCWYGDGEWYEATITDIDESGEDHDVYIVDFHEFDVDGFEVLADFLRPLELVRDMSLEEQVDKDEDEWLEEGAQIEQTNYEDDEDVGQHAAEGDEDGEERYRSESQASLRRSERTLEEFVALQLNEVGFDVEKEEDRSKPSFTWRQEAGRYVQVPMSDQEQESTNQRQAEEEEEEWSDEQGDKESGYILDVDLTPGRNLGPKARALSDMSCDRLQRARRPHSPSEGEDGDDEANEYSSRDGCKSGNEGGDLRNEEDEEEAESSSRPYEEGDLVWALMNSAWYAGVVDSWSELDSGEEVYTISFPGYIGDLGSPSTSADDFYKEGGLLFSDLRPRKDDDGEDQMPFTPRTVLDHQNLSVIFSETGSDEGSSTPHTSVDPRTAVGEGSSSEEVITEGNHLTEPSDQVEQPAREAPIDSLKDEEEEREVGEGANEKEEVVDEEVEEAEEAHVGEAEEEEVEKKEVEDDDVDDEEEEAEEEEALEVDDAERSESLKTRESVPSSDRRTLEKRSELVEETTKVLLPMLLKEQRRMFEDEQKRLREEEALLVEARMELQKATQSSLALGDSATLQVQALVLERNRLEREHEHLNKLRLEAEEERVLLKKQRDIQEKKSLEDKQIAEHEQQYQQQQLHFEQMHLNRLRQERASLSSQRSVHAALYAAAAAAEAEVAAEKAAEYYRPLSHQSPTSPLSDEESAHRLRPPPYNPPPPQYPHQVRSSQPPIHPYYAFFAQQGTSSVAHTGRSPEHGVFSEGSPVRRFTQDSVSSLSQQQTDSEHSAHLHSSQKRYVNINPQDHDLSQHGPLSPPVVVTGGWQPNPEKFGRSSPKKDRKVSSDSVTSVKSNGIDAKELSFSQAHVVTPRGDHPDHMVIQSKFTSAPNTNASSPWWETGAMKVRSKPTRVESLESIEEKPAEQNTNGADIAKTKAGSTSDETPETHSVVPVTGDLDRAPSPSAEARPVHMSASKANLTPISHSPRPKKRMEAPAGSSIRDPASVRERAKEYNDQQRKRFLNPDAVEPADNKEDECDGSLESPRKWKEEFEHTSPQSSPKCKTQEKTIMKTVSKEHTPATSSMNTSRWRDESKDEAEEDTRSPKPPMVKHRWKPPPKPIMTWLKKAKRGEEPKQSQSQSVNRLYGQFFKTQAKLEDARLRAEANEHKGPVELVSPKVEQGKWHDGRWRQIVEVARTSPTKGARHSHDMDVEASDEKSLLKEVESLLEHDFVNQPVPSSVYERIMSSVEKGGLLDSLGGHASVQALRDRLSTQTPISPSDFSIRSSPQHHSLTGSGVDRERSGLNRSWVSDHSTEHSRHRPDSPSVSSLRSSVRSISSGRLRASEDLSDDLQELLDQSNAINFLQVQRGASRKTWSHGPNRRKKRRPRPAIRSTAHMTLSNTPPPAARILKARLVRHRVKPKPDIMEVPPAIPT